jgi:hypothetical protein
MSATVIGPEIAHLLERYRTCELATVGRDGVPIAWPTIARLEPSGALLVSTSIAFPQKAINAARDPRVAALFSDPTASGLDDPPEVLVQGLTEVSEIETDMVARAGLWRRILTLQPSGKSYSSLGLTRRLMDVYYMRLYLTITPGEIRTRELLRSRHGIDVAPAGAAPDLVAIGREWRHYPDAVLAAFDTAGHPTLARIRPRIDASGIAIGLVGLDVAAGPASILVHRHDRTLASTRSEVVVGSLAADGTFTIARRIPGVRPVNPLALPRLIGGMRARAQAYLDHRGLARPQIDWSAVAEVKRSLPDVDALPERR